MDQIIQMLEQQVKLLSERSNGKGVPLDEVTRASQAMATLAERILLLSHHASHTE